MDGFHRFLKSLHCFCMNDPQYLSSSYANIFYLWQFILWKQWQSRIIIEISPFGIMLINTISFKIIFISYDISCKLKNIRWFRIWFYCHPIDSFVPGDARQFMPVKLTIGCSLLHQNYLVCITISSKLCNGMKINDLFYGRERIGEMVVSNS